MARAPVCLHTEHETDTAALGTALGPLLRAGDLVLLGGTFGAGKTVFVRGLAAGLGVTDPITSPSFALIHEYTVPAGRALRRLHHLDLYRLSTVAAVAGLGLDDYLDDEAAIVIEWPNVAVPLLPPAWLRIELATTGETGRSLLVTASGERHQQLLTDWLAALGVAPRTASAADRNGATQAACPNQPLPTAEVR